MAELKDSGNRREFESGAVRDMEEGKGRMDLVPWGVCSDLHAEMKSLFAEDCTGFIPTKNSEKCWEEAPLSHAYPMILAQMDVMDFVLNPSYADNGMTLGLRLNQIKSVFLKMAAIFCLHHWNLTVVPEEVDSEFLDEAADEIVDTAFGYAMLEVAKHYEDGARKYSENNWRKGIDPKIYFDSASRHLMKCMSGWRDEPHDRAFLWNCLCGAWECDAEVYKLENYCDAKYAVSNVDAVKKAFNDLANSIQPNG